MKKKILIAKVVLAVMLTAPLAVVTDTASSRIASAAYAGQYARFSWAKLWDLFNPVEIYPIWQGKPAGSVG